MPVTIQIPTIILPAVHPLGTEVELITDALEHTSIEIRDTSNLPIMQPFHQKTCFVLAQEVVGAGIPGPLNIWIEESPYPTAISGSFWAAIGGGGGAIVPVAPDVIAGVGTNGLIHTLAVHWNSWAPYFRIVVQTPVAVATAFWAVQLVFSAQE